MYDTVVELLITYWEGTGTSDVRTRHRCRQIASKLTPHLPPGVSQALDQNPRAYEADIREALAALSSTGDPGIRQLIRSLAKVPKPGQHISISGQSHNVVVVGGDVGGDLTVSDRHTRHQPDVPTSKRDPIRRAYLTRLRHLLTTCFDKEELRTLCFDLEVDYDSLPAQGKANKARELVVHLERRGRISDLTRLAKALRPAAPWEETN